MKDSFKRFDMQKKPKKQFLMPVVWALSFPDVKKHKSKIEKVRMDGLKPPYILLCNHNSFFDFKVVTAAVFPHRSNNVVAIDGFTMRMFGRFISREWLMRMVGCICKRKFTNDTLMVRQLKRVVDRGSILVIYPEAQYSLCGTTAILPESLGKMCRLFRVPVVSLITRGHHVNSPFWNTHDRGVRPTEAVMTQLFTAEELKSTSVEEINRRINHAFQYDDFAWQKERGIEITYEKRAEGLHKVLYQCPACGTEYRMSSSGAKLCCDACGKSWTMGTLGDLSADSGETEFSHIPDWYRWERANVRAEIEAGTYSFSDEVRVSSLPNSKGYIDLGIGRLTHNMDGFCVTGSGPYGDFEMERPVQTMYSCHIEYNYLGRYGDCVDLNTLEDTWYCYPQGSDYSVTKMAIATEELYIAMKAKKKTVTDSQA
jgi:1-acyl-sn-glycerol-3-phosphate acyltransferase